MYARVVRFTDVDPSRIEERVKAGEDRGGPPADFQFKSIKIMHDEDQGTAVVIQFFETAEDLAAAEAPLDAMDPSETPGTRASVDRGEVKLQFGDG